MNYNYLIEIKNLVFKDLIKKTTKVVNFQNTKCTLEVHFFYIGIIYAYR